MLASHAKQRDVSEVPAQRRMIMGERQHKKLDRELDVYHPARVVLQVEERSAVRMPRCHLAAHVDDIGRELGVVARQPEELVSQRLERGANRRIARHESRPRQRLVLPRPRVLVLVTTKRRE